MRKAILFTGGIVNMLLAVGHMFFWKTFNWPVELPRLSPVNQGIMQIANLMIIFIILYFAVISFLMIKYETIDFIGKSIVICIAGFYSIRLFLGYTFFGFSCGELFIWIVCAIIIIGYLSLLFVKKK